LAGLLVPPTTDLNIVPIYFSYDAECLCCFSTLGQKIEWMRENPLVCVEADEIAAHDEWVSVVAVGHYLEFSKDSEDQQSTQNWIRNGPVQADKPVSGKTPRETDQRTPLSKDT
jgi:nitroimidazol reductase NimA-like FMN-containing flavoprotein (pyridoxamine 5'-phosphate oxidase superfamily)